MKYTNSDQEGRPGRQECFTQEVTWLDPEKWKASENEDVVGHKGLSEDMNMKL